MEEARTIRDIMVPVQDVISQNEEVLIARRRLQTQTERSLIVVDGDVPVGVVEWRQIMDESEDVNTSPVSSVMTRTFPELTEDMTIEEASVQMGDIDVATIPVVDASGHLVGEVMQWEIVQQEEIEVDRASKTGAGEASSAVHPNVPAIVTGMTVFEAGGSKVGEVRDLVIGASGQLGAIVVAHGLFGRKHKQLSADLIGDVENDRVTLVINSAEFKYLPDIGHVQETA